MSTVRDIEEAIRSLSHDDLAALRAWLAAYDAARWDEQIEADVQDGQLMSFYEEMKRASANDPATPLESFLNQQGS